jgi:hypothetical protein
VGTDVATGNIVPPTLRGGKRSPGTSPGAWAVVTDVHRSRLALPALLAVVLAACGGGGRHAPAVPELADVPCGHPADLAHAPLPQETGVYRAGPLVLAIGEDLAQLPASDLAVPTGSDAIAVVSGQKPVRLTVDPSSVRRFSLQFTAPVSGSPTGAYAVRFPACGARRGGAANVHRFMGGVTAHGTGCVRLTVRPAGGPASTMLIPVGDTLRGCPTRPAPGALPAGAMPYLGVSCPVGNSIACDRVGIGVTLARPATLVTVQLAGRTVALSPPPADSPGCNCWLGYLSPAGLRRPGPLHVPVPAGQTAWAGEPVVEPFVRLTVYLPDGTVATLSGRDYVHAGFG